MAAHGSRSLRDGYIGGYLNLDDLFRMQDAILQTVPDRIQLCRLIETGLAGLDVVPYRSGTDLGDGVAPWQEAWGPGPGALPGISPFPKNFLA